MLAPCAFNAFSYWLKANPIIAWGIAPGKKIGFVYWLKAIFNAFDYDFQPKGLILISSWGDAPGYVKRGLQPKKSKTR